MIAAEDTRVTSFLCQKIGLKKPLLSLQKFNEKKRIQHLLNELKKGKNIALVSDAGTPLISDPGALLIQELSKENIDIIPIPGPSAVTTLLSVAGVNADKYIFAGFFPKKKQEAVDLFKNTRSLNIPIVFFDSPKRILGNLEWLKDNIKIKSCCVAKELTKAYESILTGSIDMLIEQLNKMTVKGEFCFVIQQEESVLEINTDLIDSLKEQGLTTKQILAVTAQLNYPKNQVYPLITKK